MNIAELNYYRNTELKSPPGKRIILQFFNLIILQFLLSVNIFPQAEYVEVNNPVYDFLNRMETLGLIENYNSFELPKSRKEIGNFLKEIMNKYNSLDETDKRILNDLKNEFQFDIYGLLISEGDSSVINRHYQSLLSGDGYDFFSQEEKYLFLHLNPDKVNFFVNLLLNGELIYRNNSKLNINSGTSLGSYGGEIRGTVLNKFGFFLRGYQGQVFGNRETARLKKEVGYNFKYNLEPEEGYFDETFGYLTADFDLLKLKLGRDRLFVGHGVLKPFVSDNSPMFDYVSLNINYEFLNFSYFHGKLLGSSFFINDSITGGSRVVDEKYLGYHRLSFDIAPSFSFGMGEMIIYGNRGIDLSYLNPFTFYKSIEHSNQDRDNSILFFDLKYKPVKGLKLFSTLLIDDISFGKIGTGWFGNQTLLHTGLFSTNLYQIIPVDISLEYLRIEPYTLTHRLPGNNFTHNGYNIGEDLHPNSELFFSQINYRFNHRLSFSASFTYTIHGANTLNDDGSIVNVGGDINLGRRVFDSEKVEFLNGKKEYLRKFFFLITYEPFNQFLFSLNIDFLNYSLQKFVNRETRIYFLINVRI